MEQIIKRIISIEEQAQQIIKNTKERKAHLPDIIGNKTVSLRSDYIKRAESKIAQIDAEESEHAAEKVIQIQNESKIQIETLKRLADKYMSEWVDTIYNDIMKL